MLTKDEIRLIVERPSKLGPGRDADEYEMEKFQRVAIEAVAEFAEGRGLCPTLDSMCPTNGYHNCRRCWREWLERQ